MSYKQTSPIAVIQGGTGASTLTGIVTGNGGSAFTASAITQHDVLVGGASNAITSVAPSATSGVPFISQGAASNPTFGTAVVAGGGTGAVTLTGVLIGNGTSAVTGNAITQHDVLLGGASNAITSLAPSATSGVALISQGAAADPAFGTVVVAGGGTGAVTLTGVLIGNGTSAVTGNAVTQHDVLVGGSSNAITSVAPSATSGIPFVSNGASADPSFTTAVVAGGGTGAVTFTAYAVICAGTTATGAFQNVSGVGSSGQVLTSQGASALPQWSTPGNTIAWSVITANQTAVINNGYICNKAGTLALLLPATAVVGSILEVTGINTATGWQITQATGQQIFFGTSSTTLGATGTLTSSATRDSIRMVCVVADTTWNVISAVGNITIV